MLRTLLIGFLLSVFLGASAKAQQIPVYSQYFHNQFIYNPAWCGLYAYGSANLTYRNQWAQVEGAPTTIVFTADLPIYEYKTGIGTNITRDSWKGTDVTKATFTYAYHIIGEYDNSSTLSFGLSAGALMYQMNVSDFYLQNQGDYVITGLQGNYLAFDLSAGMNYTFRNVFQAGISLPQLLNPGVRLSNEGRENTTLVNHALASFKGIFRTDQGLKLEPLLMLRYALGSPIQYDLGLLATYNDLLWGGVTYRTSYAITSSVGINLDRLRVGLSRDFMIGYASGALGSATEIMIGYKFHHMPYDSSVGKKGVGWGLLRHKTYHPSRPGPITKKIPRKQKSKGYKWKW